MDPLTIAVAVFVGGLFFGTQQTKKEDGDNKKQSPKPQQQPSTNNSQQQRKPVNKTITKCPHCGGSLEND